MINSPDGHCRAFDEQRPALSLETARASSLLKPLEDALADGDHIFAVIKGSAINNDGNRKVGYTARARRDKCPSSGPLITWRKWSRKASVH